MNCYAIYNKPVKAHNRPFVAVSDKEAVILVRNVLLNSNERELSLAPSDYDLVFVGNFDDVRGSYSGRRRLVCNVVDIPLPPIAEKNIEKETNSDEV